MSESEGIIQTKVKLEELCTITRGSSPRPIIDWVSNVGTPWVKISDATSQPGRYISSTKECIKDDARSKSVVVNPGDLIVSNSATPGLPKFMRIKACIHDGWLLFRNFNGILPEFLYYVILNDRKKLVAKGSGSVFTNLKTEILKNHEIYLPTISEQKVIAEVLGDIDDLVQKNTELNEKLEDVARTVFNSWFVDFDPVKSKMVGEKPFGMNDATATLVPDSMEDSELGPIPAGWNVQALSDIGEFRNGLAMQKFPVVDDDYVLPVIKIAQLRAGNTVGADLASGLIDPKYVISDGDILFSWSGTLEIEHWAGGQGALNQHLFKVLGTTVPDWFIYFSSRNHLPEFRRIASGKATTMGHIQRGHLAEAKVAVPPVELLTSAGEMFSAFIAEKVALVVQNAALTEIRDALLPRLISGELRIPEEMMVS
jgi:type I restriction enzyme S subunit